jgi:membrane-associated phospholipid phosphatase
MKQTRFLVREHRYCFGTLFFFLLSAILWLLFYSKADGFRYLNNIHNYSMDVFFMNYTFLGDGVFSVAVVMVLLWKKQTRLAMIVLAAFLSSGIIVQLLKNLIYAPRPRLFFEAWQYPHFIKGVSLSNSSAFPSGHTASAFALATVLALYFKDRRWSILLIAAAVLVGYSRIYLAQHFPEDVLVGALIGVLFAIPCYILISRHSGWRFFPERESSNTSWFNEMRSPVTR